MGALWSQPGFSEVPSQNLLMLLPLDHAFPSADASGCPLCMGGCKDEGLCGEPR